MRAASLEYFLTDILLALALEGSLAAVDSRSAGLERLKGTGVQVVTATGSGQNSGSQGSLSELCSEQVQLEALKAAAPDVILTSMRNPDKAAFERCQEELSLFLGQQAVRLYSFNPRRLDDVFSVIEGVGAALGNKGAGHDLAQRWKAQMLDLVDNFYERMRHKRVTFLAGIEPFVLGGLWIPDMIKLCSAVSQLPPGEEYRTVAWSDIVSFQPDVLFVAPLGLPLKESMRTFLTLEQLPDWERLPAVKRGEVFFADGSAHFHQPDSGIRDAMAILISAIAGIESGYISKRDSFFRMRWLELRRHELR